MKKFVEKFTTGVIALNFTNQFLEEMLDDHLCPTKFQLLLPMEFGCSVPRDRTENKDLFCVSVSRASRKIAVARRNSRRRLEDWKLFDWVAAPKEE